ncbi:unnamed protein product [Zymoseptoria tritici ST99CH_3D7]|uniref:Uncharacterized protein n=1 Tax=Zymoseptoria tritici (strain ST99CH_3D7) TaxID=1276538 RepID=A0A1X7RRD3_ZYMT9|nr:unnamed protein product [Zymoseptoria tritici ST99CH_3D7]
MRSTLATLICLIGIFQLAVGGPMPRRPHQPLPCCSSEASAISKRSPWQSTPNCTNCESIFDLFFCCWAAGARKGGSCQAIINANCQSWSEKGGR